MMEVGEGTAVGEGIAVGCGVAGGTLGAGDAVAGADGGGDGGGAGVGGGVAGGGAAGVAGGGGAGVAGGDTDDAAAGLETGATVAGGADAVVDVGTGGRREGCGDAGTMGTTELAGGGICERAAGAGATVALAFGRAGAPRASEGTSTLKARAMLSTAPSVTTTRPTSGEYAGASRGERPAREPLHHEAQAQKDRACSRGDSNGRRSSLGRSTHAAARSRRSSRQR